MENLLEEHELLTDWQKGLSQGYEILHVLLSHNNIMIFETPPDPEFSSLVLYVTNVSIVFTIFAISTLLVYLAT